MTTTKKPIILSRESLEKRYARIAESRSERQSLAKAIANKLKWLETMYSMGFRFAQLWGCNPDPSLKVVHTKKSGATSLRLRCLCKEGRKGNSCGNAGKHAVEANFTTGPDGERIKGKGYKENYSKRRASAAPNMNWAVLTGPQYGWVVIDVDVSSGGFDTLAECEKNLGTLPRECVVHTPSGGIHIYVAWPDGWDVRTIPNHPALGKGIDIKGRGGYAVAPGSLHHSGGFYRPATELASWPHLAAERPQLPQAWIETIGKSQSDLNENETAITLTDEQRQQFLTKFNETLSKNKTNKDNCDKWALAALNKECEKMANAPSGTGNETLNRCAFALGQIVGAGLLLESEVKSALLSICEARGGGTVGLVAATTIESGLKSGRTKPRWPNSNNSQKFRLWAESCSTETSLNEAVEDCLSEEWELDCSEVSSRQSQIDREIDDILIHRAELKQNDPEAFARLEEEEVRKAEILAEEQAASRKAERLTRKSVLKPDASEVPDPLEPCLPCNCNDKASGPIPFSINRCSKCTDSYSMCHECFKRIGGTRPARDKSPCRNGIRAVISKKSKSGKRAGSIIHLKCNQWHCDKCGYDLEGDYLIHHSTVFEWAQDYLDTPQLLIPSKDVKNLSTRPVDIQPAVWKVIISTDNNQAKKYANKLAKLGKNAIWYVSYYIGQNQRAFYIFLSPRFNPERLTYAMNSKYGDGQSVIAPWQITFTEFHTESRQAVSNAGRYISLSLSAWDLIDKPPGTRIRHKAVNWCRALDMPVREERTSKNTMHGKARKSEEEVIERCERENIKTYDIDPKRIDKSYYRGFSQYLIRFMRFEFPEDMPEWKVKRFYDWLTGKEDQIKPDTDDSTQEATLAGTDRLYQPLLI